MGGARCDLVLGCGWGQVLEEEQQLVGSIGQQWSLLFSEARQVDRSLGRVKKTFTEVRLRKHTALCVLYSSLVLRAPCPACSRGFPAPTHLVQMNGSL